MHIKNSGTLGDTYMCVCHLAHIEERISVDHRTKHMQWEKEIRDIYSLLPNIEHVEVTSEGSWGASPYAFLKHKMDQFVAFPDFQFPRSNLDPGKPYIAVCLKSGRNDQPGRRIPDAEKERLFSSSKLPIVTPAPDKTALLEGMGLVARSSEFYGPQGLMSYVALSHKVPSVVYVSSDKEYLAFRSRLDSRWIKYLKDVRR